MPGPITSKERPRGKKALDKGDINAAPTNERKHGDVQEGDPQRRGPARK
jgi:hypothetical protein